MGYPGMNAGVGAGLNEASRDILNMWMMNKRIQATRDAAAAAKIRAEASSRMADAYTAKMNRDSRLSAFADPNAWGGAPATPGGQKALGPSTPANQRATAAALVTEDMPGEAPPPPPPSQGAVPSPPAQRGMAEARPHAMAYSVPRPAPPPMEPQESPYQGAAQLVAPPSEPEYIDAGRTPRYAEDE